MKRMVPVGLSPTMQMDGLSASDTGVNHTAKVLGAKELTARHPVLTTTDLLGPMVY